jgi:hypothetical protein
MLKEMDALTIGAPVLFDLRDPSASRPELTRPEPAMGDPEATTRVDLTTVRG